MEFGRTISSENLKKLGELAEADSWFRDLLDCWQPAGHPITYKRFLRLAVRDQYLNFYYKGQSVAKVGFDIKNNVYFQTHSKYLGFDSKKYIRLGSKGFFECPKSGDISEYKEIGSIKDRALGHVGAEKEFVDSIVAANGSVIDMEMAFPADKELPLKAGRTRGSAYRVDIVALEQSEDLQTRLVFWEAKMSNNSELKRRRDEPKIVEQVRNYKRYLENEKHRKSIVNAYGNTCSILVKLHAMTRGIPSLSDIITDVDTGACKLSEEKIDTTVRVVIGVRGDVGQGWSGHMSKLVTKYNLKIQQIYHRENCVEEDYWLESL
jgi:hypothetical protein